MAQAAWMLLAVVLPLVMAHHAQQQNVFFVWEIGINLSLSYNDAFKNL